MCELCKADTEGELDLEIIDIKGKVMLKKAFTSTTEFTISTTGLYVVRIIENNVIKYTTKVIIK